MNVIFKLYLTIDAPKKKKVTVRDFLSIRYSMPYRLASN
ncbi:hypothetical protein H833_YJM1573L05096 [Saccharomyces cerevisiae YJM1573]|uniref:Putative uncharacterized protein YLR264C-A n=2 Tax=Saccharomyces cerevisiae TaxID=4932 RepID=YL264_YEAST|nr:uncharacterized protein YLR264C-A [Saccharomyces cerevisiae S288C]Q3E732.1 RecName: Full=Putative uncharacterized protein YLR264C-A [Saccharomyces cerevisiae S288C]pir/S78728/ protein YLR264c-a - yeast (Saccharomyces cerevisiae) [Saccharomyces cerevisiae]AJV48122.1 hypothetical protein H783_YJM1199L05095 [Saccharomyces cerevisiae YJM1199]AJV49031.1 hypothetical protein H785_YJM1208L05096 [Saccharomyces cerevisiae YJM1208]AJV53487.1 hypothetical protein H795_YJM1326L05096 [Saccharomyces cere|eukprot:NP_878129.1 hypothetical protein YLR264C-A [Saccharomyces cerevisiae S288C]